jgi:hypothetical protein
MLIYTIGGEIQLGPGVLCLENAYVDMLYDNTCKTYTQNPSLALKMWSIGVGFMNYREGVVLRVLNKK